MRWLLAPATDDVPRAQAVGAMLLRVLVGLLWLYNVSWKHAPDFGQNSGSALYRYTTEAVRYPVFPPYSWVVEHIVLHVFTPFGWLVLAAETALAVMLLTGSWVRLAAVVGIGQSLAIALSVANAPNEWPWSYWLLIGAHVVLLLGSAGRVFAVDAARAGLSSSGSLSRIWGGIAVVLGLFSVVFSLGDPLAARGPGLGSSDLMVSLGDYNLLGGLALGVVGALLVLASRGASPRLAQAVAVVAALAGLSLEAQLAFGDPLLGGTTTSAAVFFALALVAAITSRRQPTGDSRRAAPAAAVR